MVRAQWPTGTVTFLFSDVEGSTQLVQELDVAGYRALLEQHQRLLRSAFDAHGGVQRGTEGDSFFVVFRDAPAAVAAAVEAQRSLHAVGWPAGHEVRVRMGLHTGEGIRGGDDYVGVDVNRAARIASAGHGGQVLVSESTRALADRSLPSGVGLRDLGEHRLKGLAVPERVYQLIVDGLPSEFPRLRSEPSPAAHLPPRLTSFVGRTSELADVQRLLGASHLVTLVGPAGSGKTSLAIECARAAADEFQDGAWLVALDTVRDSELVPSQIVGSLELRDVGGRPASERLLENLSRRQLLLVLDNFEQVIEASAFVSELLAEASDVKVLVTSRAALHVTGEQLYPVLPLSVSVGPDPMSPADNLVDPDVLLSAPAVRLFVDRARQVQPAFRLAADNAPAVVDICTRLDGLPLGIELAAARISLLGAVGIQDRLARRAGLPAAPNRDVPERQRTLREAISWSHDLLEPTARAVFARLSVFVGGCRLQEAETVGRGDSESGVDIVDLVATLVDQSLVTASQTVDVVRYGMLETIREYAAERLAERDEAAEIQRRHALTFLTLAEGNALKFGTRGGSAVARWFALEEANLEAAVRWSIESREAEMGMRLIAALQGYWRLDGRLAERRSIALSVLDIHGADVPSRARMRALEAAGSLFYDSGDNDRADSLYREQLEVARKIGDQQGATDALFNLAFTEDWQGRHAEALARVEELVASYRELGDERSLARTEVLRASILFVDNENDARRILEAAHARFRALDDLLYEAMAASMIGGAYLKQGHSRAAARWFVEMLVVVREIGDMPRVAMLLPIEAVAALELGRPEAAAVILGAFDALSRRYGVQQPAGLEQALAFMDPRKRVKSALDQAAYKAAFRQGQEMTLEQVVAYVLEMAEPLMKGIAT
jgi:predicted ATPase/class 3 adenylate cyclase